VFCYVGPGFELSGGRVRILLLPVQLQAQAECAWEINCDS
jgi:hypothetical protein